MLHLPLRFLAPPEVVTALTALASLFHFLCELVLSPSPCPRPEPWPFPRPSRPSRLPRLPRPPRPPRWPPDLENLDLALSILDWLMGLGHFGTPWSGSLLNAWNISFASLHSFLIPPRWDESLSEVRVQSCLKRSPTSKWLNLCLKTMREHFVSPSSSWMVHSHGRAATLASLSVMATSYSVATRTSSLGTLAMPSLANSQRNPGG